MIPALRTSVDEVADAVRACRFHYANEDRLQAGLAAALRAAGFIVEREVRLDRRSRIDLLVGRVGIEVKVGGATEDVRRQCIRYLASDRIDGLVLVTTRVRHHLPWAIEGKPIVVVQLAGAGL